ncbi:MBL fold metallo-hydrolase [Geoglobus acetivorans]|uniref:MBL fold metallo-hydrolase n=1 Tax=Geoglobus acetivorans TaxID=565033 RepID=A0ABZ3H3N9_GEOAI|nr:MBL fold metallo-hydrolase [Geoglobus acetivorans]
MLATERIGDVERIEVGAEVEGRVVFTTSFYVYSDLVFDSGCSNVRGEVAEWLKKRDFQAVYLTHHHEDHSGNAGLFDVIHSGKATAEILSSGFEIPDYRKLVWGEVEHIPAERFREPDIEFVYTPGHSQDHVVYLLDDYAFIGDLIAAKRVFVALRYERYVQTIESLERLLSHDFEVAFGGHGIYRREEVEEYLGYLRGLRQRCLELYESGKSYMEIYAEVFGEPGERAMLFEKFSGGEWSRENLVKSLIGIQ